VIPLDGETVESLPDVDDDLVEEVTLNHPHLLRVHDLPLDRPKTLSRGKKGQF